MEFFARLFALNEALFGESFTAKPWDAIHIVFVS